MNCPGQDRNSECAANLALRTHSGKNIAPLSQSLDFVAVLIWVDGYGGIAPDGSVTALA